MQNLKFLSILAALSATTVLSGAVSLSGDTSEPATSMYELGRQAELLYHVSGLTPEQNDLKLELNIVDEKDRPVKKITVPVKADSQGNWNTKIAAPSEKLGFYRVHSKLSNGVTLPKLASRKAGFLTYAIVFGEKRYQEYPMDETFFGSHGPSFGFHRMIGLRWGYLGKNWTALEPKESGTYVHNPNAEKENLLKPLPEWKEYYQTNQNSYPKWFDNPKYVLRKDGKQLIRFTPEGEKLYSEYLRIFAKNYAKQMKKNQPRAFIQILWEPMFPWGFAGTPKDLVRIHEIAYKAIHEVTPDAWVIGPSSAGLNTVEWHRELFAAGLLKYIDAIAIHPYFNFPPEQNGIVETVRALKAAIREFAGKDLDIHGNEAGFATHELPEREVLQMHGLVRSNLIFLGEGFRSNMLFYSHDYWGEPGYGYTYNLNPKISFGTNKIAPKPVVPAIGAAAYFLNGHTSAGAIEYLGDTAWGYAYQRKDGFTTLALWDFSGNPREIEIQTGRNEITLGDIMGNTKKLKTDNGNLKLVLTEDPVYVIDVDPGTWGRDAVRTIAVDHSKINSIAGKTIDLSGKINAGKTDRSGTLRLSFDKKMNLPPIEQNINVKKGESRKFTLTPILPGTLPKGKYPVILTWIENGKCIASSGILLTVQSPIVINDVLPDFQGDKKALQINMSEISGSECSGKLDARIVGNPEGRKRISFRIPKGKTENVTGVYEELETNPLKKDALEISVVTSGGYRFKFNTEINFIQAVYLPNWKSGNDFAAWKNVPDYTMDPSMALDETKIYQGRKDLDASIAFGWNREYLLFYVDVRDDVFYQPNTGWATWNGDSLQMGFTKSVHYKKTGNMYQDKMELAYSELDFALTSKGPEVYRTITFDPANLPVAQVSLKDAPLTVKKTDRPRDGVRLQYEVAIPWKFLNITNPSPGMRIGWAMTVNDRDEKKGVLANLQAFQLKKTEDFGIIVLGKQK